MFEQYRFVNNFDRQDDEEFQQCQLAFYKQEILNALITNNRMDSDPESELTRKLGQYDLSICQEIVDLIRLTNV